MNINYKQPQFELFEAKSATLEDVNKPRFMLANLTLSIESLVILTILGIMMALFSFSLGVERGKHLTAQALDDRVSEAWNLAPHRPVMPVALPKAALAVHVSQNNAGFIRRAAAVIPKQAVAPVAKQAVFARSAAAQFTVQVASYKSEAYAKQEALGLIAKGMQSFLIKKGDFWLVCLGQFANQESANVALKKVPPKFRGSTVRRF